MIEAWCLTSVEIPKSRALIRAHGAFRGEVLDTGLVLSRWRARTLVRSFKAGTIISTPAGLTRYVSHSALRASGSRWEPTKMDQSSEAR